MKLDILGLEFFVHKTHRADLGDGFEFRWNADHGPLTWEWLYKLGQYFGTQLIDLDNYSQGGCDTCGYGEEHGYEIAVYHPTINVPVFPPEPPKHQPVFFAPTLAPAVCCDPEPWMWTNPVKCTVKVPDG